MIDLHTFVGGWITGLATGVSLMRWRSRSSTPHRESQPTFAELLMPLPRDRDPDWRRSINHENTNAPSGPPPLRWRKKGSDVWHPLGNEPDWADLARQTVTVRGFNWPATLGDFTLVGPADNQGAWRWYERQRNGTTERVKVEHQLQRLGRTTPPPREP